MGYLRFTILAAGFLTFLAAIMVLISHSVPGMDFLHAGGGGMSEPFSTGFLAHVAAAIMLGGVGYLLVSFGKGG